MHGHIFSKMQRGGLAPSCYRPSNDQPDEAGALHALLNMLYMVKISPPPPVALCVMALSASLIRRPAARIFISVIFFRITFASPTCEPLRAAACGVRKTGWREGNERSEGEGGHTRATLRVRRMGVAARRRRRPRARDRAGYELIKF